MFGYKWLLLEVLLAVTCRLGDTITFQFGTKHSLVSALADSLTHGLIAGISWAIVIDIRVLFVCFLHIDKLVHLWPSNKNDFVKATLLEQFECL